MTLICVQINGYLRVDRNACTHSVFVTNGYGLVEDRGGKTWISTYAAVYDVWCSDYIRVCPSCFKN